MYVYIFTFTFVISPTKVYTEKRKTESFVPPFYIFSSSELEMPFWQLGFVGSEASWRGEWAGESRGSLWCPLIRVYGRPTPARIVERICPFESGTKGRDSFRFDLPGLAWSGLAWWALGMLSRTGIFLLFTACETTWKRRRQCRRGEREGSR